MDTDGCPDTPPRPVTAPMVRDSDRDGIHDAQDMCPVHPETWNKYNDADGCPDVFPGQSGQANDDDLDRIPNESDSCPLIPEDYDNDRDTDGCPE